MSIVVTIAQFYVVLPVTQCNHKRRILGFPRSLLRSRPAHPLPVFGNSCSQQYHVSNNNSSAQAIASLFARTSCLVLFLPCNSLLFNTHPKGQKGQNTSNPTIPRENTSPHLTLPPIQGFHLPWQPIRQDRRSLCERLLRKQLHVRRVQQLGVYGGGT